MRLSRILGAGEVQVKSHFPGWRGLEWRELPIRLTTVAYLPENSREAR
jgi:hypothetical protein